MNFEKLALAKALSTPDILNHLEVSQFTTKSSRFIFKAIKAYYDKKGILPTKELLESTIRTQISEDKAEMFVGYLKGLKLTDTPIDDILEGLGENKLIKEVDKNIAELLEAGEAKDTSRIKEILTRLNQSLSNQDHDLTDAKDIEFSIDTLKMLDCFVEGVSTKLQGVVLVSAVSGGGKSIFSMNQALHSYKQGNDVLYLNLELSSNEQMARMLSCELDIPFQDIYTNLSPEKVKEYNQLKEKVFGLPNKFKMRNSPVDADTIMDIIRAEARTGLDLVVIDYLQIVDSGKDEAWKFLTNFVRDLHRLSLELGIVIITPIQINVEEIDEKSGKMKLTTRGARELEFSASLWFHIYQNKEEIEANLCRLFTMKARQARKDTYVLETNFEYMKFKGTGVVL